MAKVIPADDDTELTPIISNVSNRTNAQYRRRRGDPAPNSGQTTVGKIAFIDDARKIQTTPLIAQSLFALQENDVTC